MVLVCLRGLRVLEQAGSGRVAGSGRGGCCGSAVRLGVQVAAVRLGYGWSSCLQVDGMGAGGSALGWVRYRSSRYFGCGHGWLATEGNRLDLPMLGVILINPFRKEVVPLNLAWHSETEKLILYGDPTLKEDNSFMVVSVEGSVITFLRGKGLADRTSLGSYGNYWLTEAVFYKGQVYAVDKNVGRIVSFDVNSYSVGKSPRPKIHYTSDMCSSSHSYLVESTKGELLHIRRFLKLQRNRKGIAMPFTHTFEVYKLVFDDTGSVVKQVELKTIGDETVFVGDCQSMSVLASRYSWCKPNSIYYTSDSLAVEGDLNFDGTESDMGIFSLEKGTTSPIQCEPQGLEPAVWILPPLNSLC